jgi:LPXTG-motif cell wall-anchored protein
MLPSTGSETLDVVMQLAVIAALLASLVLLVRNYRGR